MPDNPSNLRYPKPTRGFLIHRCVKFLGDFRINLVNQENDVKQIVVAYTSIPWMSKKKVQGKTKGYAWEYVVKSLTECTLTNLSNQAVEIFRWIEIISKSS